VADQEQTMLATTNSKTVQTVAAGEGPIWQRDYWVVLPQSTLSPPEIMHLLRTEFPLFSPDALTRFERLDGKSTPLEVGDEMRVTITGAGTSEVRVVGVAPYALTLRTLDGHIEAGRISFGSYETRGQIVLRIRSRARSASTHRHIAYMLFGHALQMKEWKVFIARLAQRCGAEHVEVQTRTRRVKSTLADLGELDTPTFAPTPP
jgi:hypothetical protein